MGARPPAYPAESRLRLLTAVLARGTTPEAAEEVATILGVSPLTLARWIAGLNVPFESDRDRIERFLRKDEVKRASAVVS